ncbi:MAG TPA: ParB/RepB/Spo0J family partition protein [Stellaceae bacterium]|jgi:ParB family chromosome partitioning protein|nr:ParB/RepB/Spo0J family partition protein [Stellaceae bacterium]
MTSPAAQWQLDRLSTSAREAAEIASLGAGVSLSSWLTKLISETCSAEGVASPAEPPKILEFTREIHDPIPSTPRIEPAPTPTPANISLPPRQQSIQPIAPVIAPAAPMPAPTPPVAPFGAYRPQSVQVTPILAPFQQQPLPPQAIAPTPLAAAPVDIAFVPPAPIAPAPVAFVPPVMAPPVFAPVAAQPAPPPVPAGATMLPIAAMVVANLGTRRDDDVPETLLADIATRGMRQPVLVRRSASNPDQYEIICGHRRWRAAQRVGLAQIPASVGAQDDATAILASLAENLQQGNLSVLDEAQAYLRLLTQYTVDVSAVTAASGRERSHIVQSMRLLGLPPLVRHLIGSGVLSREHALVLLDAPHPEVLADAILAEHLSVEAARQRVAADAELAP